MARSWLKRLFTTRARRRRLLFAFAPPADAWPSAYLRGHQVMRLIQELRPDVACHAVSLSALTQSRGEHVVLTKSALSEMTAETVMRLRALRHYLIADPVDLPLDDSVAEAADFLLASSISQQRFLRARCPALPVCLVTHHVDLRMPAVRVRAGTDRARFGYFGNENHCLHGDDIADLVTVVSATHPTDQAWMARLGEFNAHYALRVETAPDIFKPFLKGFVAAHCGVPIVVGADDEEARHYLGADYPFVVDDLSLAAVRARLTEFADAFGTPSWRSAQAAMRDVAARSDRRNVERELGQFLSVLAL
jgi:hypothetical protein